MRILTGAFVLAIAAVAGLGQAEAKGCLKEAVVGGLAGRMVGHGVAGAAAGCAIGHHRANRDTITNTVPTSAGSPTTTTITRSY